MYFLRNLFYMFMRYFGYLIRWPRRLHVSLPMGIALIVAMFLLICVAVVVVVSQKTDRAFLQEWYGRLPIVLGVILAISVVTYYAVKLWLQEGVSAFGDIDRAWKAGLEELNRKGINILETPIFLLFGSQGERSMRGLMSASRLELPVEGAPKGAEEALHFYANRDGVYISLNRVGCLSLINAAQHKLDEEYSSQRWQGDASPSSEPMGGLIPGAARSATATMATEGGGLLQAPMGGSPFASPFGGRGGGGGGGSDIKGTMQFGGGGGGGGGGGAFNPQATIVFGSAPADRGPRPKLSSRVQRVDLDLETQRLEHLCRLIRRERQSICPVNGALNFIPYGMLVGDKETPAEVRKALAADMATAVRVLKLRFPATTVVVNMENETGFGELITRLGREKVRHQRFGKGFDVWTRPLREYVEQTSAQACGAFESFIYHLFREKGALDKPNNRKLYALLCKVRYYAQKQLCDILPAAYSDESSKDLKAELPLFSGCYFAATGEKSDDQAFIKNVFDRLPEQQEDLEWTQAALHEDRRYRRFALVGGALCLAFVVVLGVLVYRSFG